MKIFSPALPLARWLSARSAHDKALCWSGLGDAHILARAGMWLAALERPDCPPALRLKALLLCGAAEDFWRLADARPQALARAGVYGLLARLHPARAAALPGMPEALKQYCAVAQGRDAGPEYSPYARWLAAAQRNDLPRANACLAQLYSPHGLTPPELVRSGKGFCLACAPRRTAAARRKPPLVSIIMTARDEAPRVGMAIDSLLAQSFADFELLAVDDASQDGTADIIRDRAHSDPRVIPLALPANAGTFAAKNTALAHARGEYVMMHDADDWSHPERLRLMLAALARPHVKAVSSRIIRVDEATGQPVAEDVRNFCRWNPSSFLFRREFFERHGGYLSLLGADCEFVARHEMLHGVAAHARLGLPLCIGLSKPQSLSRKFRGASGGRRRLEEWEAWRRRHADYLGRHRSLLWRP